MVARNRLLITRRHAFFLPPLCLSLKPTAPLTLLSLLSLVALVALVSLLVLLSLLSLPRPRRPIPVPTRHGYPSDIIPRHPLLAPITPPLPLIFGLTDAVPAEFLVRVRVWVLGDNVPGVEQAGQVAEHAEEQVQQRVEGAEGALDPDGDGGEEDGDEGEEEVGRGAGGHGFLEVCRLRMGFCGCVWGEDLDVFLDLGSDIGLKVSEYAVSGGVGV